MHPVESGYPVGPQVGQPVPLVPELEESNEFGLPIPDLEESKTIEIGSPVRQQQEEVRVQCQCVHGGVV